MTRAAWWHCFAGIAGDMAFGSLVDAGADLSEVVESLRSLPIYGWSVKATRTSRKALASTQLLVELEASSPPQVTNWADIRRLLEGASQLPERARDRALRIFSSLAAAEARAHNVPAEQVHFHEVGAVDAIVDIVGTCLALEALDIGRVFSSPVALGMGTVRSGHGFLPHPGPAVLELLRGAPAYGTSETVELTTPTGAAIVAALAEGFGPMPPMEIGATGYGAGTRELDEIPNVVQVVLGEMRQAASGDGPGLTELTVLETNVDDVTGEVLAHTLSALLNAGALDAWLVPVVAKKGRPGQIICALVEPWAIGEAVRVISTETGSLGTRQSSVRRFAVPREETEVEIGGYAVRVKAGPHRLKAEFEDCAVVAAKLGLPVAEVARQAEQSAYQDDRFSGRAQPSKRHDTERGERDA
ncbi:MAG TPA: nickel pincer cofactor biosynthesis protein LarC [Acidimicrobiales bacterium]|nr:nickel pincer cofactor biosynthesis protein LarC [Acidimicrobiales bacterium]